MSRGRAKRAIRFSRQVCLGSAPTMTSHTVSDPSPMRPGESVRRELVHQRWRQERQPTNARKRHQDAEESGDVADVTRRYAISRQ